MAPRNCSGALFYAVRYFIEDKKKPVNSRLTGFGGEGGIRTLETLLGFTRFPVVRARPGYATSPSLIEFVKRLFHVP